MDQKLKLSGKDILGYLLLAFSVIMLGKSLMLCFSSDIWYDELFTVGMIEHSCGELIGLTARDVHPPLYYIITKIAVDLCKLILPAANTVVIAKAVSVLPYFILLLYCVTLIRRRFSLFTGGLFLFCSISMPQLSSYTVEVRMYSWALLFVTAAFLHAFGITGACGKTVDQEAGRTAGADDDENNCQESGSLEINVRLKTRTGRKSVSMQRLHAAALVGYGLAAAYTQYFACVAVIMVYLYVLFAFVQKDRGRIKEWLLWVVISIVGYVPWLFTLYTQITAVSASYWILPLSWRTFGGCVKFLMKPAFTNDQLNTVLAVVFFVFCLAVFVCEGRKLYRYRRDKSIDGDNTVCIGEERKVSRGQNMDTGKDTGRLEVMIAGAGVLAGLVSFGFAASMLVRPIFVYRYMIPAMGCFWLGIAAGLDDLWKTTRIRIPVSVILFIVIIGLRDYRAFMGEEEYKIYLMEQTEAALSCIAPDDIVIYNFDQVQAVTSYYLPEKTESYLWCGTPEILIQDIIRPYGMVEETSQIKAWCEEGRRVWFIGSFNSRDDIVEEWAKEGVQAEETDSCLLERYWFNLYKISI